MALLVQDDEMKEVQWNTPVSKLAPDFVLESEEMTKSVSVEDILSHRSGIPCHDESTLGVNAGTPDTPASVMRNMRNLPFKQPLRTKHQYCNIMYTCAAHTVSLLSNTPFQDFLRNRFWRPLGMDRTFLGLERIPSSEEPTFAQGYVWVEKKSENVPRPRLPEPESVGNGSIISNVEDVARWISAFVNRLPPLSDQSYTDLATPRILEDTSPSPYESPSFYALGWSISWYHGHALIEHGGFWRGFVSRMLYIPSKEWGIVMLGNNENAGLTETELQWHLIDELLEIPTEKRFDWRAWFEKDEDSAKETSKEDVYPELKDHEFKNAEPLQEPKLEHLAGTYSNQGYHDIELKYNAQKQQLEADCSGRSIAFLLAIKERAYGYWYIADCIDLVSENKRQLRSKFEVDKNGYGVKFGVELDDESGLILFEKVKF
ncbi:hypothetical protein N0V90_009395 [Kalmusia sp. IMI 367209]|nr:hypothetical protein N0V90_009395 [Kalmusia sp. IMI 367209]